MKKTLFTFFLTASIIIFSSFTTSEKTNTLTTPTLVGGCSEGYSEVSWSVTCPNGITYTGSRCFRSEHALQIAETILNAPCPN